MLNKVWYAWDHANDRLVAYALRRLGAEEASQETEEKIRYSLYVIFSEVEKTLLLLLLATIFGYTIPFVIAYLSLVPIRMFTGGTHNKSNLGCFLHTVFVFVLILVLARMFDTIRWMRLAFVLLALVLTWVAAPIRAQLRYKKSKRMEFKRKATVVLVIQLVLQMFFDGEYIDICSMAVVVQCMDMLWGIGQQALDRSK